MMITAPAIPGFAFTKQSYEDLLDRFHGIGGWSSELLGESVNGREVYGFWLGDIEAKPVMYVQAQIHGWHEWRTSYWASEFMKLLANPGLSPAHTSIINALKEKYAFYFIPSVNPDGYGTADTPGPYTNANRVSVSQNFGFNWSAGNHEADPPSDSYRGPSPFSEPESQIVRDKVLDLLPVSLLCLHTWGSGTVGYMTRRAQNPGDAARFEQFWADINATLGYGTGFTKQLEAKLATGSAYNWAGTLVSSAGRNIIGQVWESGGGMSDIDQSRVGMTGILYHMLMVDSMLPGGGTLWEGAVASSWGPLRVGGESLPVVGVDVSVGGELLPVWRP